MKRELVLRSLAVGAVIYLWAGPPLAIVAMGFVPAAARVATHRRAAARSSRIDEAIPSFAESVSAALRAGAAPAEAIREADALDELSQARDACIRLLDVGAPFTEAMAAFADLAATPQSRMLATALTVGHHTGGDLPRVLDILAALGRDRSAMAREAKAATAQARISAWVVASLPLVFLVMSAATSPQQLRMLTGTAPGWMLLAAGAALEGAGIVWMRWLSR